MNQEVELALVSNVTVRTKNLPSRFDDKGRVMKFTAKEIKELKGPGNLPGYTADFDDLQAGQVVQMSLGKTGTATVVTMIVIQGP
jgi:hypothetical protein